MDQELLSKAKELKETDLYSKFNEIKNKEVKKAANNTIVNLRAYSGCGCGGSRTYIHAIVPEGVNFNYDDYEDFDFDDMEKYQKRGIVFQSGSVYDKDNFDEDMYESY